MLSLTLSIPTLYKVSTGKFLLSIFLSDNLLRVVHKKVNFWLSLLSIVLERSLNLLSNSKYFEEEKAHRFEPRLCKNSFSILLFLRSFVVPTKQVYQFMWKLHRYAWLYCHLRHLSPFPYMINLIHWFLFLLFEQDKELVTGLSIVQQQFQPISQRPFLFCSRQILVYHKF
jgi:hypothetical protein